MATRYLDELTRAKRIDLDYFVVFSSVSCGFGNAGQTNYGMANAIMERIIEKRCKDKLAGKAIQWGAIGDIGAGYKLLQATKKSNQNQQLFGFNLQNIYSCLKVLDQLLMSPDPIVSSYVVGEKVQHKKSTLISSVLASIGVKDIKSLSLKSTMTEIGVDSMRSNEISQQIKMNYNLTITSDKLKTMTLQEMIDLSKKFENSSPQNDNDEVDNGKNVINKQNVDENVIVKANDVPDVNYTDDIILFVPGYEGILTDSTKFFCKKLNKPTYVLQYHHTRHMVTVKDVVQALAAVSFKALPKSIIHYNL